MTTITPQGQLSVAEARRMRETMKLGDRLRWARKRKKLSHDRLGAATGTSRQHLIRLEQNLHRPKQPLREAIAAALAHDEGETDAMRELLEADEDDEADHVPAQRHRRVYELFEELLSLAADKKHEPAGQPLEAVLDGLAVKGA